MRLIVAKKSNSCENKKKNLATEATKELEFQKNEGEQRRQVGLKGRN